MMMLKIVFLTCGVCWLSVASGGVIKDQEENLTYDAVAEEAVLKNLASTAILTEDENKIVDLLKRIQEKFGTLEEGEKVEFKKKIASYQDRFITTLEKVEKVPGMYGLDVQLLRSNLGIPDIEETLEEIHDPRDAREFEEEISDATVEVVPKTEETKGKDDLSLERAAAAPSISVSVEAQPKRTLNDVYDVMTQLVQLVLVQIIQEENEPEPVVPNYYYYPSMPAKPSIPFPRAKSPNKPKKPSPARSIPPGHMRQRQVPFNHDLAGILNVIPTSYDDVSVHYNFPNKRHRRSSEEGEEEADEEIEDEALNVALEYAEWYDNVYMPWFTHSQQQYREIMEELQDMPQMDEDFSEAFSYLENYNQAIQQLQEYMQAIN